MPLRKVIISGGGTGGHIFPAIAIANALKELSPGVEILFVGAKGKMEMQKVPAAGYTIEGLNISGLQRKLSIKNFILPFKIIGSLIKAGKILDRFQPQVAIGVGGYASSALVYMAAKRKIPILLQEQNSFPGKTNKFLSRYAERICVAYPEMEKFFPAQKITVTGNPVRQDIEQIKFTREQGIQFFGLNTVQTTLLVFGGSQGARAINEGMENALAVLRENNIQAVWQTGKHFYQRAKELVERERYTNVKVFEFIEKMNYAYAAADLVVSRAGAIAVAELAITGKASILVPLPTAAEDHQTKNAMALVNRNAAILLKNDVTPLELKEIVISTLSNPLEIQKLEKNIGLFAMHESAKVIASEVLKLVKE